MEFVSIDTALGACASESIELLSQCHPIAAECKRTNTATDNARVPPRWQECLQDDPRTSQHTRTASADNSADNTAYSLDAGCHL
jgi:hypothetical protein